MDENEKRKSEKACAYQRSRIVRGPNRQTSRERKPSD